MVKYMKKNNIFIISIIVVILVSLCTIAGTYAVIINVTNEIPNGLEILEVNFYEKGSEDMDNISSKDNK